MGPQGIVRPRAHDVLVVVDMQNWFMGAGGGHILAPVLALVRRWSQAGGRVLFTRYVNAPGSPHERLLGWREMRGSPDVDIAPALLPYTRSADVLDKHVYTLFTGEGQELAARRGWTDLYFCGVDTECCVAQSAVGAFEHGLTPWVITDACTSHVGPDAHDAGMLVLRRTIGRRQLITVDGLGLGTLPEMCEPDVRTTRENR